MIQSVVSYLLIVIQSVVSYLLIVIQSVVSYLLIVIQSVVSYLLIVIQSVVSYLGAIQVLRNAVVTDILEKYGSRLLALRGGGWASNFLEKALHNS